MATYNPPPPPPQKKKKKKKKEDYMDPPLSFTLYLKQ